MIAINPDQKANGIRFDAHLIKCKLQQENEFIKKLFSTLAIPTSALQDEEDEQNTSRKPGIKHSGPHDKTRAQSLTELQDRLKNVQSKKRLNYKEKLEKKGLKNRLKRKTKREERTQNKTLVRMQKLNEKPSNSEAQPGNEPKNVKTTKPVFNREGKMVFSKFDFSGLGIKNEKKSEKDPKKILKNLEKQKFKLAELEAKGKKEKATELKQKQAWKNVLAKSEGEKVKDDPIILKKSIKKREHTRKGSEKKWQARQEGVKKAQDAKQFKRQENLDKRKKEKKHKKRKTAVKKGKVIPGF